MTLLPLDIDILRACNGEVVQLPYDDNQRAASARLHGMGLIQPCMEDDQPTAYITDAGRAALSGQ